MHKLWQYFAFASILVLVAACVTTVNRGHLKEDEAISTLKEGVTTRAEALKALGSPSSESTFGPPTWYYVSSIKQSHAVFMPEIIDQHVTEITFNGQGVIISIKQYSLKDGKNIEIASRTTPTEGQHLGIFEQILANLGRFNKEGEDNSISNSHTHGNTNPGGSGYPR